MTKFFGALLLLLLSAPFAHAQLGKISGKVIDGDVTMPFTRVELRNGETILVRTQTDGDGKYEVGKVEAGKYTLKVLSGDVEQEFAISISTGEFIHKDLKLGQLGTVKIFDSAKQLFTIDPSDPITVTRDEIAQSRLRDPEDIISSFGGVYQKDQGDPLNIRGGRSGGIVTFQDGVKLVGPSDVPAAAINQVTLFDSGIPAEYGDLTSGVLVISTYNPGMRGHSGKPMTRAERKALRERQKNPPKGSQLDNGGDLLALAQ